ncbi:MAG: D-glycero-beta-D-manno-heptose-7-phosphate kinase [Ignavibacteria bacterium]|nr:D-glycero-beta-D-manno-heptose-7-phosphate kinase [Ignavibacteria bacterium]
MVNVELNRAKEILTLCQGATVAVIGDVMLDRFFWGNVSRISPEAPVPVVDIESETAHLGGAANVASNLKSLGINPLLCGTVGSDFSGKIFIDIAKQAGIPDTGIYINNKRPTTVKTRIIGNNQHIVRLDREERERIESDCEDFILNTLKNATGLTSLIFEDYNKGVVTASLIRRVTKWANQNNVQVYIDPKFDNFFEFKNTTVFKPNLKEAQRALGFTIKSQEDVVNAGKMLLEKLSCKNVLLTLGKDGMVLFEDNGDVSSVETKALKVADVSGAGDTAIASLAAALAGGATVKEAATLANTAAGIVCEQPGIVSVTVNEILDRII